MLVATEEKTPEYWYGIADRIAAKIGETAAAHDRDGSFVAENYDLLRESGLIGAAVPVELGGDGMDHATLCGVVRRIGLAAGGGDRDEGRGRLPDRRAQGLFERVPGRQSADDERGL